MVRGRVAAALSAQRGDLGAYLVVVLGTVAYVVIEHQDHLTFFGHEYFHHTPMAASAVLLGIVKGCLNALPALAMVLVFRINRVINFAQGDLGGFAAVLAAELLFYEGWPYPLALLAAVAASGLAAAIIELTIVRYFFEAPRLILTVATIGVAQILAAIQLITPSLFEGKPSIGFVFPDPFAYSFEVDRLFGAQFSYHTFTSSDVLAMLLAPGLGLGLYLLLRYTTLGAAIRASGEDLGRVRGLGVPAKRLSTLVWIIAGVISAVSSVLSARINGFAFGQLVGPGFLMRSIAPAAIGRFDNLGLTFVSAVAIGVIETGVLNDFSSDGPVEVTLFAIVLGSLLLRRPLSGRRAQAETSTWQLLREVRQIPVALRGLREVKLLRWGVPSVALVGLLMPPVFFGPGQLGLAEVVLIYAMVGISLVMLSGWAGQVSLGQWAIAGVGALTAAQLFTSGAHIGPVRIDFFLSLFLGGLAGSAVAVAIGVPSLRIGGYFLAAATLAFAVAARAKLFFLPFVVVPNEVPRPLLFGVFNAWDERVFYCIVLVAFILAYVIATRFRNSRLGRALVAVRDNELAGVALGYSPARLKLVTFVLSGFLAAFAGGLYAFAQQFTLGVTSRGRVFEPQTSLYLFAIVVFGGLGSPAGAALGAAVVLGIQYFGLGDYTFLATGAGILIMLIVAPGGLGQVLYDLRDSVLRRIARRHGLDVPALLGDAVATAAPTVSAPHVVSAEPA